MKAEVKGQGTKTTPFINVTPLIDVLLVLLIIFMAASPLRPSRFKTLIPEPLKPDAREVPIGTNLRVDVQPDLKLKLNGEEVGSVNDISALSSKLSDLFAQRERARSFRFGTSEVEKTVFIKAPRAIRYGEVAKVIDGIKGAGATPVGLQIDDLN